MKKRDNSGPCGSGSVQKYSLHLAWENQTDQEEREGEKKKGHVK